MSKEKEQITDEKKSICKYIPNSFLFQSNFWKIFSSATGVGITHTVLSASPFSEAVLYAPLNNGCIFSAFDEPC